MPLPKQLVQVDFGLGLDTGTDPKRVIPGRLTEAENIRFRKGNKLSKRYGYTAMGSDTNAIERLLVHGSQLLAKQKQSHKLKRYVSGSSGTGWIDSPVTGAQYGQLPIPKAWSRRIGPGSRGGTTLSQSIAGCDFAINTKVFVSLAYWSSISGNVLTLDVVDRNTGRLVRVGDQISGVHAARILPIPSSDNFVIAVNTTTAAAPIQIYTYDPFVGTLTNVTATPTNLSAALLWDWCIVPGSPNYLFVGYKTTTSGTSFTLAKINMTSWANSTVAFTSPSAPTAFGVAVPRSGATDIKMLFADAVNGTYSIWYTTNLVLSQAFIAVLAAPAPAELLTGCEDPSGNLYVAAQISAAPTAEYNRRILRGYVTAAASGSTVDAFYSGCLASKLLWCPEQNQAFCWAVYSTTLQPTYFLTGFNSATSQGNCIARARLYHASAGPRLTQTLPNLSAMSDGTYATNARYIERLNAAGLSSSQPVYSTCSIWFSGNAKDGLQSLNVDGRTLIAGGVLGTFDGSNAVENGFLLFPEIVSTGTTAGSIAAGTYQIVAVYEWIDAQGMLHRSAVSPAVSVTIGGVAAITVTVQSYRPTTPAKKVTIAVYRTIGVGGTTFYRATSNVDNDVTTVSVTATLTNPDASIQANDVLYASGGVLDFWQPSAPIAFAADENRVCVVEGDNPSRTMISREIVRGEGLAFFEDYTRKVGVGDEDVFAVGAMFGRKLAFKERAIYAAVGTGADQALQNDDLGLFEPVAPDVGAINQRSVVITSHGAVFKSDKGFWLLGRDLSPAYIGVGAEDYNGRMVSGACYDPDNNEATFLLDNSTALVLSLDFGEQGLSWKWSLDTQMTGVDIAAISGRKYLALSTPGTAAVYYEDSSTFVDNHASPTGIVQKITTGWLTFNTIAGFGRCYTVYVLGDSKSTHTAKVELAFDYADFSETHTITSANATIDGTPYLFEVKLTKQKLTALRLRITDVTPTGESFEMTGMVLRVGAKNSGAKLRSEKRA